jgi:hypothetical protein
MVLSSKPDAFRSDLNWASVRSWPPGKVSMTMSISFEGHDVAGGNHAVGDQELAICGNHFAAVAEDPGALFVCPIVNDVAEEVGVSASGNAFEKAAFDDGAAVGQACGFQFLFGAANDVAEVEQDALHVWIACEHSGQ